MGGKNFPPVADGGGVFRFNRVLLGHAPDAILRPTLSTGVPKSFEMAFVPASRT
jgi:hypothetical protein